MPELSAKVSVQGAFLRVEVAGENSVANVVNYLAQVHAACAHHNCPYVLLEENLSGPALSIEEIYSIVSTGGQRAWPTVQVIACLDLNPEHIATRLRITESVADGVGLKVKWFESISEAEQWLLQMISKSLGA